MTRQEAEMLLVMAEEAAPHLAEGDSQSWCDRLATRHDHLSAATRFFVEARDAAPAVRLAAALHRYWFDRAHHAEARRLCDAVLAIPGAEHEPMYADVDVASARFAFFTGDPDAARMFEHAIKACRQVGDSGNEVEAIIGLSRVALREHRFDDVRRHAGDARTIARELGDRGRERIPIHMLAATARMTGDYPLARQLYGESIALSKEIGRLVMIPTEHHNLGYVALHEGDIDGAERLFRQALTEARQYKANFLFPYLILDFGVLALARGELVKAATLVAASDARFEALGISLDPDDAAEREAAEKRLEAQLDPKQRAKAARAGGALSEEEGLRLAQ